jgi:hypothetical protein
MTRVLFISLWCCLTVGCAPGAAADAGTDAGRGPRFVDDGGLNGTDGGGMCIRCGMIAGFITTGGGPMMMMMGGDPCADAGMPPMGGAFAGCNPPVFDAFTACLSGSCAASCGFGGSMAPQLCGGDAGAAPSADAGSSGLSCQGCLETRCTSAFAACKADP